jgi:hypothetical protein
MDVEDVGGGENGNVGEAGSPSSSTHSFDCPPASLTFDPRDEEDEDPQDHEEDEDPQDHEEDEEDPQDHAVVDMDGATEGYSPSVVDSPSFAAMGGGAARRRPSTAERRSQGWKRSRRRGTNFKANFTAPRHTGGWG